jgi:hypothetical protein
MNGADQLIVVIKHEEQYSIWRSDREVPDGWRPVRHSGTALHPRMGRRRDDGGRPWAASQCTTGIALAGIDISHPVGE